MSDDFWGSPGVPFVIPYCSANPLRKGRDWRR